MADGISVPISAEPFPDVKTGALDRANAVPWYVWCCVLATVSAMIGGTWDITWHKTIGRDTFWTPPHMLIYLCAL